MASAPPLLGKPPRKPAGLRKLKPRAPNDDRRRLESEIADFQSQLARLETRSRVLKSIVAGGVAVAAIAGLAISLIDTTPTSGLWSLSERLMQLTRSPLGATLLGILVTAFVGIQASYISSRGRIEAEIELREAKARIATELPPGPAEGDQPQQSYFESLVKINVDNLAEYYSLVKVHTNNSFKASLGVGLIGFVLIMIGVIAGFGGVATATPAKVAATSGVLTEFISGVFFYLYSKTVRQLKDYHDSLLAVQNILLSFKLVSDTEDPATRRDMTSQMCTFLLAGSGFPSLRGKSEPMAENSAATRDPK